MKQHQLLPAARPWRRTAAYLAASLLALLVLGVGALLLLYPAPYVYRTLVWMDSDVDDRFRFPVREIAARPGAQELPVVSDGERVRAAFAAALPGTDMDIWLAAQQTMGLSCCSMAVCCTRAITWATAAMTGRRRFRWPSLFFPRWCWRRWRMG